MSDIDEIEGDYVYLNEDTIPVKRELRKPKFRDRKKMASSSTSELEVPVLVKGTQKWVTGLTKRTTCDDVIYALLYQDGLHEHVNTSAYAIFEKWREVERPLQGRTKIVKVWRAWGAEQSNVHLSMRRIDELEYSGEFSLTRRKKKSRHRTRDRDRERERQSRDHRHRHHGYCQNTSERLRSMEAIVKLVISQERNLKDLIEHSGDTDKLIEKYESRQHVSRLKQNGEDYVQDAYLESYSEDSMDSFFSRVNIDDLEEYSKYCDMIIELEDQIANEHTKIEDLAFQIQMCIDENNVQSDSKPEYSEISNVQVELNRAVTCSIMQQYKSKDIIKELQFYDEKLQSKENQYTRLQQELSEIENSGHSLRDNSENNNDIVVLQQSSGSKDSLKSVNYKNPLPLPERTSRSHHSTPPPPPIPERKNPLPIPERTRTLSEVAKQNVDNYNDIKDNATDSTRVHIPQRKPILKQSTSNGELKNEYVENHKTSVNSEPKVRFKTDALVDKYYWEESSLSEGISMDQSDCSDSKDLFDLGTKRDNYSFIKPGVADKPYLTVKVEDNDSNSDTGLSSMHSDDSAVYHLETLV